MRKLCELGGGGGGAVKHEEAFGNFLFIKRDASREKITNWKIKIL